MSSHTRHQPHQTSGRLYTWKGDLAQSDSLLQECFFHAQELEEKANVLRLNSRNHWLRNDFSEAFNVTIKALKILGIDVSTSPSRRQADVMFEQVKNEILAVGFDEILSIPRTTDIKTELAVTLLNDAGSHAYWSPSPSIFSDVIGLTVRAHNNFKVLLLTGPSVDNSTGSPVSSHGTK